MMVLNHDQYYSVNLCEEKSSIQVDIILGHSMKKSAENRKHLIDFFQTMLEKICHDLIPASSKPIPYIQCPHCDKVHLKLRNALEGTGPDVQYDASLRGLLSGSLQGISRYQISCVLSHCIVITISIM